MDMIDVFDRTTAWTASKLAGATDKLDAQTPCEEWTVRRLIDHLLAGQRMFAGGPAGEPISPPSGPPPELVGDDPAAQYEEARIATREAYAKPGALEGTVKSPNGDIPAMQILGIAICDQLIHGWDLAKATGQDATMPPDLAAMAWGVLNGRLTDESRGPGKNFGPAVAVSDTASDQDKLIGYCGRTP